MTQGSDSAIEPINDDQLATFDKAVNFWRLQYEKLGMPFQWFSPRRWSSDQVIIGNGVDAGLALRPVATGYELVMSRERAGDDLATYYSRFEDAVKDVVRILGREFRSDAYTSSWLTWRGHVAEGVVRHDLEGGRARYGLATDPSVYCIIGSYDGDEFSPALTMSIDEFNQAILDDPGIVPPGRR